MSTERKQISVLDIIEMKRTKRKVVMLTAYDALFAALVDQAGVDLILVGDSVNTVLAGEATTLSATIDQMIYHGRIVRSGVRRAMVVVDMPFMSFQVSVEDARRNVGRVIKETGVAGVKLEGGSAVAPTAEALVAMGVPVMGHLGFTPQAINALGGYRVQGRDTRSADRMVADAKSLEGAGVFAIVLELMPSVVARRITESISIPTIGIGSGADCDGQVLVLHDMLGLNEGFEPRFLKRFAELAEVVRGAVRNYADEVRSGRYPDATHAYDE
jgi:3-methyl-2-oxobutanoate hydroxymethyltransferase